MPDILPITITPDTHPLTIRLSQAYRPHTQPDYDGLLFKSPTHCSIKGLTQQCGLDYKKEINRRR